MSEAERRQRLGLAVGLAVLGLLLGVLGLVAGSEGWSWAALGAWRGDEASAPDWRTVLFEIRVPRTLGAWLAGALLGLAGAVAQGLFRNPLADPYLLGSAAGASLGVVLVLAAAALVTGESAGAVATVA
jgi:iron complex transport system permease protein